MRRTLAVLIVAACGATESGDGGGGAAGSTSTSGASESAQPPGDTTSAGSGDTTAADSGDTSQPPSTTGGAPIDLGPCARLLDCVDALDDQPITALIAAYGPDGTCWAEFEAEACWQDCVAVLDPLAGECAAEPACCECTSDRDCTDPEEPSCSPEGACGPVPEPDCTPLEACGEGIQIVILENACEASTCPEGQIEAMTACLFASAADTAAACDAVIAAADCGFSGEAACGSNCLDEIAAVGACL